MVSVLVGKNNVLPKSINTFDLKQIANLQMFLSTKDSSNKLPKPLLELQFLMLSFEYPNARRGNNFLEILMLL